MKRCVKYFVGILLILSILADIKSALALTYSQDIGISFTFNPVIGLTLSASDLIIPSLAPGTAADSNIIDINVITNSTNGYTLNASVGNNTTYDTRSLIHTNNTVTNTFSSVDIDYIARDKTTLDDNTWAYSYSMDNGATWISHNTGSTTLTGYSGLPLYSDTEHVAQLKNSSTPVSSASGDNIKFKIAAKASNTQASGEYRNIINFQLTATPLPTTLSMAYENAGKEKLNGYFKLQDMNADICNAAEVLDEGSEMQAIDTRDNKVYWITKLRDGKCWMTQNLDHDINKDFAYTPENTDIPANWTPDKSTYQTGDTTWQICAAGNNPPYYDGCFIQQSYNPGDKIWDGVPRDWYSGQTLDNMTQGTNPHYHLGNYYNFGAAVAMNDTDSIYDQDVDQSICPAGWTLPKIDHNSNISQPGYFYYMIEQYGWNKNGDQTMQNPYIWDAPLYFPLGGKWIRSYSTSGAFDSSISQIGFWRSSTRMLYNDDNFLAVDTLMPYYDGTIDPYNYVEAGDGVSVRCVSR